MPLNLLRDAPPLKAGLKYLLKHDPVFKAQGWKITDITRTQNTASFETLVRIILGQQVSVAAADTMWKRLVENKLTSAKKLKNYTASDLRACGISGQKAGYILGLAEAVNNKIFDLKKLQSAEDDEVLKAITALKGFGTWSAQMFMMFALLRPDVWPAGDLAIQKGMQIYGRKRTRPDIKITEKMGLKFAPHRTAAALLTWKLSHTKPLS